MKKILVIFSLTLILKVNAQNNSRIAFYDAVYLEQLYSKNNDTLIHSDARVKNVLDYYFGKDSTRLTLVLFKNPFLKQVFFNNFGAVDLKGSTFNSAFVSTPSSTISTLSNFNVSSIADGVAQFLIKRGKEELDAAFFNQFKNFLNKHEECEILFPATLDFLKNIDPYKYSEFLQSLREAFNKDLNNLIIHLNQVIDLPKYDALIIKNPEIKLVVKTANIVSELSQSGNSITPDNVISQLADLPWKNGTKNLGTALNFLDLISKSIKENDTSTHRSWVQLSELNKNLFADETTLKIYFGLLYQQAQTKNLTFYNDDKDSIRVDTLLARLSNRISSLSGLIENFSLLADDIDKAIEDFKVKKDKGSFTNDDYYTYISKAINIIEYGFKTANTLKISDPIKNAVLYDKYIGIARNANDLYKNIYTKNYNNAVANACNILDSIFTADSLSKTWSGILKYGNFMASVIKAESGEEVESAIEAAALPAGSYSVKQKSEWNLSVNGYIGYARDYNHGLFAQGVYAPVGLAFSHGSKNNGFALSVFASVIDVGAVATYRLNNGLDDSLKQEIKLGSIFSPSAQLMIEKAKFPLALCLGWRLSPRLVYSNQDQFTIVSARNVFNAAILIDIPFFTLWNKPYLNHK